MTDKELDELIEKAMEYEDEKLLEMIHNDPSLEGVEAPDSLHDRVFAAIRVAEKEEELKREREERRKLEKRIVRVKRWNKLVVLIAAIVCVLALGSTSMGGPKRVLEDVTWWLAGRKQKNVDTDDDRIVAQDGVDEAEALEAIEEEFGVFPVRLSYLPLNMKFSECVIEKETQNARLFYEGEQNETICYIMMFNYRTLSTGTDVEDSIKKEYEVTVENIPVLMQQIDVEGSNVQRWRAEFQHNEVQYYIEMNGINEAEVEKIVKNLYFF